MARPQVHKCARCRKEMAYEDKWMMYVYKTQAHGKLEVRKRIDLCEGCAKRLTGAVIRCCEKGG